jgi:hypothetical protein
MSESPGKVTDTGPIKDATESGVYNVGLFGAFQLRMVCASDIEDIKT